MEFGTLTLPNMACMQSARTSSRQADAGEREERGM